MSRLDTIRTLLEEKRALPQEPQIDPPGTDDAGVQWQVEQMELANDSPFQYRQPYVQDPAVLRREVIRDLQHKKNIASMNMDYTDPGGFIRGIHAQLGSGVATIEMAVGKAWKNGTWLAPTTMIPGPHRKLMQWAGDKLIGRAEDIQHDVDLMRRGGLAEGAGGFVGFMFDPLYMGAFGLTGKVTLKLFTKLAGATGTQAVELALKFGLKEETARRIGMWTADASRMGHHGAAGFGLAGAVSGYAEEGTEIGAMVGGFEGMAEGVLISLAFGMPIRAAMGRLPKMFPKLAEQIDRELSREWTSYEVMAEWGLKDPLTEKAIKSAYRDKAKALHPDKGGDPIEFARVLKQYDTLKKTLSEIAEPYVPTPPKEPQKQLGVDEVPKPPVIPKPPVAPAPPPAPVTKAKEMVDKVKAVERKDIAAELTKAGVTVDEDATLELLQAQKRLVDKALEGKKKAKEKFRAEEKAAKEKAAAAEETGKTRLVSKGIGREYTKKRAEDVLIEASQETGGPMASAVSEAIEKWEAVSSETFRLPPDALSDLTPILRARIIKGGFPEHSATGMYTEQVEAVGETLMARATEEIIDRFRGKGLDQDVVARNILDNPQLATTDQWWAAYAYEARKESEVKVTETKTKKGKKDRIVQAGKQVAVDAGELQSGNVFMVHGKRWSVFDLDGKLWMTDGEYQVPVDPETVVPVDKGKLDRFAQVTTIFDKEKQKISIGDEVMFVDGAGPGTIKAIRKDDAGAYLAGIEWADYDQGLDWQLGEAIRKATEQDITASEEAVVAEKQAAKGPFFDANGVQLEVDDRVRFLDPIPSQEGAVGTVAEFDVTTLEQGTPVPIVRVLWDGKQYPEWDATSDVVKEVAGGEAEGPIPVEVAPYAELSYKEVQKAAKERGLPASGARHQIVARMEKADLGYKGMAYKDLQAAIKEKGLLRGGKKADMIKRLEEADEVVPTVEEEDAAQIQQELDDLVPDLTPESLEFILSETGLPADSPALSEDILPRPSDMSLGDSLGDEIVTQIWRTATAKKKDGLLHLTLTEGDYERSISGKEATDWQDRQLDADEIKSTITSAVDRADKIKDLADANYAKRYPKRKKSEMGGTTAPRAQTRLQWESLFRKVMKGRTVEQSIQERLYAAGLKPGDAGKAYIADEVPELPTELQIGRPKVSDETDPLTGIQQGLTPELAPTMIGTQKSFLPADVTKSQLQAEVDAEEAKKERDLAADEADAAPTKPLFEGGGPTIDLPADLQQAVEAVKEATPIKWSELTPADRLEMANALSRERIGKENPNDQEIIEIIWPRKYKVKTLLDAFWARQADPVQRETSIEHDMFILQPFIRDNDHRLEIINLLNTALLANRATRTKAPVVHPLDITDKERGMVHRQRVKEDKKRKILAAEAKVIQDQRLVEVAKSLPWINKLPKSHQKYARDFALYLMSGKTLPGPNFGKVGRKAVYVIQDRVRDSLKPPPPQYTLSADQNAAGIKKLAGAGKLGDVSMMIELNSAAWLMPNGRLRLFDNHNEGYEAAGFRSAFEAMNAGAIRMLNSTIQMGVAPTEAQIRTMMELASNEQITYIHVEYDGLDSYAQESGNNPMEKRAAVRKVVDHANKQAPQATLGGNIESIYPDLAKVVGSSEAFSSISPGHSDFEANFIQPLLKGGWLGEAEAHVLRGIMAKSMMLDPSQRDIHAEIVTEIKQQPGDPDIGEAKIAGIIEYGEYGEFDIPLENVHKGPPEKWGMRRYTVKLTRMAQLAPPEQRLLFVLHEMLHAGIKNALKHKVHKQELNALFDHLVKSGTMKKYLGVAGESPAIQKVLEAHFTKDMEEFFAEYGAHSAVRRHIGIKRLWEIIRRTARRLVTFIKSLRAQHPQNDPIGKRLDEMVDMLLGIKRSEAQVSLDSALLRLKQGIETGKRSKDMSPEELIQWFKEQGLSDYLGPMDKTLYGPGNKKADLSFLEEKYSTVLPILMVSQRRNTQMLIMPNGVVLSVGQQHWLEGRGQQYLGYIVAYNDSVDINTPVTASQHHTLLRMSIWVRGDFTFILPGSYNVEHAFGAVEARRIVKRLRIQPAPGEVMRTRRPRAGDRGFYPPQQTLFSDITPAQNLLLEKMTDASIVGAGYINALTDPNVEGKPQKPGFRKWREKMIAAMGEESAPPWFKKFDRQVWFFAQHLAEIKQYNDETVKQFIMGNLGEKNILVTTEHAMAYAEEHEVDTGSFDFKGGILHEQSSIGEIIQYVQNELPKIEQFRLLPLLKRKRAIVRKAEMIEAINKIIASYKKREAVKKFLKQVKEAKDAGLRPEYAERFEELVRDIWLKKPTKKKIHELSERLTAYYDEMTEKGEAGDEDPESQIHQRLVDHAIRTLEKLVRDPVTIAGVVQEGPPPRVKDLSLGEIEDIIRAIQMIIHQNRVKVELIGKLQGRTQEEVRTLMVSEAGGRGGNRMGEPFFDPKDGYGRRPTLMHSWSGKAIEIFWGSHVDPYGRIFQIAGDVGGDPRLTMTMQLLQNDLIDGHHRQEVFIFREEDGIHGKMAELGLTIEDLESWSLYLAKETVLSSLPGWQRDPMNRGRARKIDWQVVQLPAKSAYNIRDKDRTYQTEITLTKAERMTLYLHFKDPRTREMLTRNRRTGITFNTRYEDKHPVFILGYEALVAIRDSMTGQERQMADYLWSRQNDPARAAEINAVSRDTHGYDIVTNLKTWPRQTSNIFKKREPNKAHRWLKGHLEDQGILKPRVPWHEIPLVATDAFETFFSHTQRLGAFLGKAQAIHNARRMVQEGIEGLEWQEEIQSRWKYGKQYMHEFRTMIDAYEGMDYSSGSVVDQAFEQMMRNIQAGTLKLKPWIVMYQRVSELNLREIAGNKAFSEGWSDRLNKNSPYHMTKREALEEMFRESPRLRRRSQGGAVQILTPGAIPELGRMFYGKRTDPITLRGIHYVDEQVMASVWFVAKAAVRQRGIDPKHDVYWDEVRREAEHYVSRSQPHWDIYELPSMQRLARKYPLAKMLPGIPFSSQRNSIFNTFVLASVRYQYSGQTYEDKLSLLRTFMHVVLLNGILIWGLRKGFFIALASLATALVAYQPRDETWLEDAGEILGRIMGQWVGLGGVIGEALTQIFTSDRDMEQVAERMTSTLVAGPIKDVPATILRGFQAAGSIGDEGSLDKFVLFAQTAARAGSIIGLPTQGAEQMLRPFLPQRNRRSVILNNLWKHWDDETKRRRNIEALIADVEKEGNDIYAARASILSSASGRHKSGRITDEEYADIRNHPDIPPPRPKVGKKMRRIGG